MGNAVREPGLHRQRLHEQRGRIHQWRQRLHHGQGDVLRHGENDDLRLPQSRNGLRTGAADVVAGSRVEHHHAASVGTQELDEHRADGAGAAGHDDGRGVGCGRAAHRPSSPATDRQRRIVNALTIVSSNSSSGSESATIAPPTPKVTAESVATIVRITIDRSAVPDSER